MITEFDEKAGHKIYKEICDTIFGEGTVTAKNSNWNYYLYMLATHDEHKDFQ